MIFFLNFKFYESKSWEPFPYVFLAQGRVRQDAVALVLVVSAVIIMMMIIIIIIIIIIIM